jgi:hypothetical protein
LTALLLASTAGTADVPRRLLASEAGLGGSVGGAGFSTPGGRFGEAVTGRLLYGRLVLRGPTFEVRARLDLPWDAASRSQAGVGELRLGWTGERWSAIGGVVVQHGFNAQPPFQVLPSVRAQLKVGEVTLVAGVFDYLGFAPAHLSVERGDFGVGYLAPFGVESHFRLRLREYLGVLFQAMALRLGPAELVMATFTITVGYAAGKPPKDRAPVPGILDDRM